MIQGEGVKIEKDRGRSHLQPCSESTLHNRRHPNCGFKREKGVFYNHLKHRMLCFKIFFCDFEYIFTISVHELPQMQKRDDNRCPEDFVPQLFGFTDFSLHFPVTNDKNTFHLT